MSKKSGLFYLMLTWMFGLFSEGYKIHSPSHFQPSGSTNRFSGGQEITSYGKKPVYKPLHPEQKKAKQKYNFSLQGITWDSIENRFYWASRKIMQEKQQIS